MYQGIFTALITAFRNQKIDEKAMLNLIEKQVQAGVGGVVPCGTTGESPTLSHSEHDFLIELAVKTVAKRVKVMAGTGSNSTEEAIRMTKFAEKIGADSALIVVPYYNKPSQQGLFEHFKAIHDSSDIPIFLYNVPSRSVASISLELLERLAKLPRIIGIKDATADLALPMIVKKKIGQDFIQFSGEDATALAFNMAGGVGCISVTANIAPQLCVKLQQHFFRGEFKEAMKLQDSLINLHQAMFCETNPMPVKYAASLLGLSSEELRLPLVSVSDISKQKIKQALAELGLGRIVN